MKNSDIKKKKKTRGLGIYPEKVFFRSRMVHYRIRILPSRASMPDYGQ